MMIFTSIYGIVDGIFVSNCAGSEAFAAVNLIYPVIMIVGAVGFMIGTGGSALDSKTIGEGKKDVANRYFSMLVYFLIISEKIPELRILATSEEAGIYALATDSGKQIFISIDKINSLTDRSITIIEEKKVLTLYPDGGELFGRCWNKK